MPHLHLSDLEYYLALSFAPGIGPVQFAQIRARFPEIQAIFAENESQLAAWGVPATAIPAILHPPKKMLETTLSWAAEPENHLLTWESESYPDLLKQIYAPPPVLFAKGKLACLQLPALAVVGSRSPTHAGKENAFHFSKELALRGLTVVSGLALGIDAASHQGALSVGGACVAVMGTGLDKIYPAQHRDLAMRVLEKGCWLSEFPLGTVIKPENFPRRNRLISGLSQGVWVVEAALRSGSLITARYALEQGREVYAMPGSIHNPLAKGCHALLKQGAKLVETVEDLIEEIQIKSSSYQTFMTEEKIAVEQVVDEGMRSLLKCIDFEPTSFDTLVARSAFSSQRVASLLARLELEEYILKEGCGYIRITREVRHA
ncbi:MAG: DNA-protecting protein DprA [Gammaproteobacteria bacterium]|nr:DNA-protecting protein DprA [Gammaproteobacteria bacterium]